MIEPRPRFGVAAIAAALAAVLLAAATPALAELPSATSEQAVVEASSDGMAPQAPADSRPKPGPRPDPKRKPAPTAIDPNRGFTVDAEFSAMRLAFAVVALGLVVGGLWLGARGREKHLRRTRRGALLVLALASYGSYYYFFQLHHVGGIDAEDAFQYYTNSKYFPELGYFRLHECSFTALVEAGAKRPTDAQWVRDLRTLDIKTARSALRRGESCPDDFSPQRWADFKNDTVWFHSRMKDEHFHHLLIDRGFQPSPVWTLFGRPLSSVVPADITAMARLVRGDRVLIGLALLVIGWAFGLEAACLATIVWATGFNWRYSWIGDNFFRLPWLSMSIIGLCFARRGFAATSGSFLAVGGLLRLFPSVFAAGYVLHGIRKWIAQRKIEHSLTSFVVGGAVTGAVLVAASILVADRGPGVYLDFYEKISTFFGDKASNTVGLSAVVGGPVRWAITLGAVGAFWWVLRGIEAWEAAAMSFTLIPILSAPTNYYHAYVVVAALLATRRPRIAVWLLLACIAWSVNGLVFYRNDVEWIGASWIAVAFALVTLFEMSRPALPHAVAKAAADQPALEGGDEAAA